MRSQVNAWFACTRVLISFRFERARKYGAGLESLDCTVQALKRERGLYGANFERGKGTVGYRL